MHTEGKPFPNAHAVTAVNASCKGTFVCSPTSSEVPILLPRGTAESLLQKEGCLPHISQPRLLHFFLCLLLQGGDFGSRLVLAGVPAVYREQLKAISVADGLPEGALFIQQLLNRFILLHFVVLDYLKKHFPLLGG